MRQIGDVLADLEQSRAGLREVAQLSPADTQLLVGRLAADVLLREPNARASYALLPSAPGGVTRNPEFVQAAHASPHPRPAISAPNPGFFVTLGRSAGKGPCDEWTFGCDDPG